jgi:hypothetical protein
MSMGPQSDAVLTEILRRAQLARQLPSVNNSAPDQGVQPVQQLPQGPPPGIAMPSNRELAGDQYRQAAAQPPPSREEYHPSVGRRIGGALLGAIAGMHDPKTGYEVGHGAVYGPYDRKLSEYQQNLERKKQLFEEENKASGEEAKIGAEVNRSGAEKARQERETVQKKNLEWTGSPEGRDFELQKLHIQHPLNAKAVPVTVTLGNGEKMNVLKREDGSYFDPSTNTVVGLGAIKKEEPLETKAPVTSTHFDESRGMGIELTPGQPPKATPVPGMTPKPIETLEDRARARTEHEDRADNRARMAAAASTARQDHAADIKHNEPSTQAKSRGESATAALPHIDKMESLIKRVETKLGPAKGRLNDFLAGKLGTNDPDYIELMDERKFLAAAVTQMHTGARGGKAYLDEFNDMLAKGSQDPANLRRALKVARGWANDYIDVAKGHKSEKELDEKGTFDELLKK